MVDKRIVHCTCLKVRCIFLNFRPTCLYCHITYNMHQILFSIPEFLSCIHHQTCGYSRAV